jgi:hypothetical protein
LTQNFHQCYRPTSLNNFLFIQGFTRVGAGNAVEVGNSGAAVTGYETSTATQLNAGEGGAVGLKPEVRTTADAT